MTINHAVSFDVWPLREAWTDSVMMRWRVATAEARRRAAEPMTLSGAMVECFDSGRPFSFLPSVDTIDRVRMRDAWEMIRRIYHVPA